VLTACGGIPDEAGETSTTAAASESTATSDGSSEETTSTTETAASDEPIVVGLLLPTTGNFAANGQDAIDGWNLYWQLNGNEVAGREIVTVDADTGGDPAIALQKVNALIEVDGADIIVGPLLANIGVAVGEQLIDRGIPHISPVQCANALTQQLASPTFARLGGLSCGQTSHPFGQWVADEGFTEIMMLCPDFVFGYEVCGAFADTFTDAGGTIVEQLWFPINNQDFGTFITQIQERSPAALYALPIGGGTAGFLQAWEDFGMQSSDIQLLMGGVPTDPSNLRNFQDVDFLEGVISSWHYAEGSDATATTDFVDSFIAEYGEVPSFYSAGAFTAANWVAEAIAAADGAVEDTDRFMEAVYSVSPDASPLGPQTLDEFGNPDTNVYIRQLVRRDDGLLWNEVIETFEGVSQFWTYDPADYMENRVYNRDFQGLDN